MFVFVEEYKFPYTGPFLKKTRTFLNNWCSAQNITHFLTILRKKDATLLIYGTVQLINEENRAFVQLYASYYGKIQQIQDLNIFQLKIRILDEKCILATGLGE